MSGSFVFITLVSLFYLPLAGSSNFKDPRNLQECPESFSGRTENFHNRAISLFSQVGSLSMTGAAEILKSEHPETLRILSRKIFRSNGMDRAKYNLAYALGENQTGDPELHLLLSEALLWERNSGVQREMAHALGRINGRIDPFDSQIQWNLVEVIQSQAEAGVKLQAIDALAEVIKKTESRDTEIPLILAEVLLDLKGSKQAQVREKIYDLFESVPQHINRKTRQRFLDLVNSEEYPLAEKQRVDRILEQSRSNYMLIIERLRMKWLAPFIN